MTVRIIQLWLSLVLTSVVFSSAGAQSESGALTGEKRKSFKDWLAACRSDGYCTGTAYVRPGTGAHGEAYVLRVGRKAGTETAWNISFIAVDHTPKPGAEITFEVDDESPWPLNDGPGFAAIGSSNEYFIMARSVLPELLSQMRLGSSMQVVFEDTTDAWRTALFSLRGLSATMLWIDAQQQRVGRSSQVAPPDGSSNKETYSIEVSAAELPADIQSLHSASADCEDWESQAGGNQKANKMKLDAEHSLFIVPCFFGAYNFVSKLYVVGKSGEAAPQLFAEGDAKDGWYGTDLLVNAHYEPGSRLLSSFSKGRGLGDCGSAGTWRWKEGRFVMREFRAWADCSNGRRPERWPVLFKPKK